MNSGNHVVRVVCSVCDTDQGDTMELEEDTQEYAVICAACLEEGRRRAERMSRGGS